MADPLFALSPLDGRYREKLENVANAFSEFALIKYRLFVELEWFLYLCNDVKLPGTRKLSDKETKIVRELHHDFDALDAKRVKEFEKKTNHDVKALEYFIKEHLKAYPKIFALGEFIHFGCTSEDINNLAYALMLKDFGTQEFMPLLTGVMQKIHELAKKYASVPMLSRTHGQVASPTTIGKELINFAARLEAQFALLKAIPRYGKMNGAVGNFNAHFAAYPKLDWLNLSKKFVQQLGLEPNLYTTQIEPHDMLCARFDTVARINTILIDMCRDIWTYISFGYFKQKVVEGQVGSSTMPHKVNPIDFENAEGNLGLANALFRHMSEKLPISRLQRDLSDSTVMRNMGVSFGYSVLAYKSLLIGLNKLELNSSAVKKDLEENFEVLAEAIQTVLRAHKIEGAYETLKTLTRGKKLTREDFQKFIKTLKIPADDKNRLLKLTPEKYTGLAEILVRQYKFTNR